MLTFLLCICERNDNIEYREMEFSKFVLTCILANRYDNLFLSSCKSEYIIEYSVFFIYKTDLYDYVQLIKEEEN